MRWNLVLPMLTDSASHAHSLDGARRRLLLDWVLELAKKAPNERMGPLLTQLALATRRHEDKALFGLVINRCLEFSGPGQKEVLADIMLEAFRSPEPNAAKEVLKQIKSCRKYFGMKSTRELLPAMIAASPLGNSQAWKEL